MKKRWLIVIIVIILGGSLIWLGLKTLNTPAVGIVKNIPAASKAGQQPTWITLSGKQFNTMYLSNYVLKQNNGTNSGDSFFYVADGLVTKHLAVAVSSMGSHSLDDEPSYKLRVLHPETYHLDMRVIAGQKVPVMIRLDNTEQVAFLVNGSKLGTIALVTGDPADPPVDEINHMIGSWTWN